MAGAGAAPARQARKRTAKSPSTTNPSSHSNGAAAEAAEAAPVLSQAPAETAAGYAPLFDEIARVAYSYWVARGCQGGSAEDDWLRAERELRSRRSLEANA